VVDRETEATTQSGSLKVGEGTNLKKSQIGLAVKALHKRRVPLDLPAHLRRPRLITLHLRPLLLLLEPAPLTIRHTRLLARRGYLALKRGHRVIRADPIGKCVPRARRVNHRRRDKTGWRSRGRHDDGSCGRALARHCSMTRGVAPGVAGAESRRLQNLRSTHLRDRHPLEVGRECP
jgi:hypothetical protein